MHSLIIVAGFFLMILAPCAFAIFSARDPEDARATRFKSFKPSRDKPSRDFRPASWRAARPSASGQYDLVLQTESPRSREATSHPAVVSQPAHAAAPAHAETPAPQRSQGASTLLGIAADAEAHSIAAQVYAAQASKNAATAIARAAAARAAAATALAVEAERAVAEATRMAAAVRRAYETAPPSVGPTNHHLPETHPSMDFPRSHVIRRAA